jgi:hypothetical protein
MDVFAFVMERQKRHTAAVVPSRKRRVQTMEEQVEDALQSKYASVDVKQVMFAPASKGRSTNMWPAAIVIGTGCGFLNCL